MAESDDSELTSNPPGDGAPHEPPKMLESRRGSEDYSGKDLEHLSDLEHVRERPSMYIGDTYARGLHHMVYEVVDNSIDEAMAGHASEINVTIHVDNAITVVDNGRGIPVDRHESGTDTMLNDGNNCRATSIDGI